MATQTETQTETWLAKARALGPVIEQYRDQGEAERRMPAPLFQAMYAAGVYRTLLPSAFGGESLPIAAAARVVEEVASHDGAVAWNLFIGSAGGLFADYLPEDVAREVASKGIVAGSFGSGGQAVPVEGGYRVTGTWSFASGCHNAAWFLGGCLITEDGRPRTNAAGLPDVQLLVMPADECQILDTWYSVGLRGSGSHHIEAQDVFVPQGWGFSFAALRQPPAPRPSLGHTPGFFPLQCPIMVAISLGIAADALASFKALATEKTPRNTAGVLATQPTAQETLGRAEALVRAARACMYNETARFEAAVAAGGDLTQAHNLLRLASVHAATSCTQAVDLLFDAAGGTSVYATSRLERCFRDVHTVTHHTILTPTTMDQIGAWLMTAPRVEPEAPAGELPAKARALGPIIEQHRDESEAQRQMPVELFEAMQGAGIFDSMRLRIYGGAQVSVEEQTRMVVEIARSDGAAAWNAMIAGHMGTLADYLPEAGAREVFAPATRLVAGTFTPQGTARAVEGGYRVTGRWPFGSGCVHADWLVGTAMVEGDEASGPRLMFIPASQCHILDTWRTTGLRGTGSHHFEATDVFVPSHLSFWQADFYAGPSTPGAAYPRSFFDVAAPPMAAVALGIARDAVDSFLAMAASKRPARGTATLGAMSTTHRRLAKAEALLRCARDATYQAARLVDVPPTGDADEATEVSASVRLACIFAVENAQQAVDIVYEAAGGTSVYETSRLEHCFRDVHMISHHVLMSPSHFEMIGQYLLGLGLQFRR